MSDTEYGAREAMYDLSAILPSESIRSEKKRQAKIRIADFLHTLEAAHREPVSDDAQLSTISPIDSRLIVGDDAGWRDSDARSASDFLRGYLDTNGTRYARQMLATITTALTAAQSERDAEAGKVARLAKRGRMLSAENPHLVQALVTIFNARADGEWAKRLAGEALTKASEAAIAAALAPQPTGDSDE